MTYSALSHILSSIRTGMQKEPDLRAKGKHIYSLYEMRHHRLFGFSFPLKAGLPFLCFVRKQRKQ